MDSDFLIIMGWCVFALIALGVFEVLDTIKKNIGLKQEQLKTPPLQPRQPVVIVEEEQPPRQLTPRVVRAEGQNVPPPAQ